MAAYTNLPSPKPPPRRGLYDNDLQSRENRRSKTLETHPNAIARGPWPRIQIYPPPNPLRGGGFMITTCKAGKTEGPRPSKHIPTLLLAAHGRVCKATLPSRLYDALKNQANGINNHNNRQAIRNDARCASAMHTGRRSGYDVPNRLQRSGNHRRTYPKSIITFHSLSLHPIRTQHSFPAIHWARHTSNAPPGAVPRSRQSLPRRAARASDRRTRYKTRHSSWRIPASKSRTAQ